MGPLTFLGGGGSILGSGLLKGVGSALGTFGLGQYSSAQAHKRNMGAYGKRWQMNMRDLRKAGLNPILAAQSGMGGPPSAPSAVPGQVGEGFSSAKKMIAETGKIKAEEDKILEEIKVVGEQFWTELFTQGEIMSRTDLNFEGAAKYREEVKFFAQKTKESLSITNINDADIERVKVAAQKLRASLVRAEKEGQVHESWIGTGLAYVSQILEAFGFKSGVVYPIGGGSQKGRSK